MLSDVEWMKGSGLTRGEKGAVSPTAHMGEEGEPLCHCSVVGMPG